MSDHGYADCQVCKWDFVVVDQKFGTMSKSTLAKMIEVLHLADKHPEDYARITHRDPQDLIRQNPDVYRTLKRYL